jgi:uncharacterized coiled-coil protein SlyX
MSPHESGSDKVLKGQLRASIASLEKDPGTVEVCGRHSGLVSSQVTLCRAAEQQIDQNQETATALNRIEVTLGNQDQVLTDLSSSVHEFHQRFGGTADAVDRLAKEMQAQNHKTNESKTSCFGTLKFGKLQVTGAAAVVAALGIVLASILGWVVYDNQSIKATMHNVAMQVGAPGEKGDPIP